MIRWLVVAAHDEQHSAFYVRAMCHRHTDILRQTNTQTHGENGIYMYLYFEREGGRERMSENDKRCGSGRCAGVIASNNTDIFQNASVFFVV